MKAGSVAGRTLVGDYVQIKIKGKLYLAQKLAWLYMTGTWPEGKMDHIDLTRSNNAWLNLRPASSSQNSCNKKAQSNNKLGLKGVHKAQGKYRSYVTYEGKSYDLGCFPTPEEAHEAYRDKARELHGEFARTE